MEQVANAHDPVTELCEYIAEILGMPYSYIVTHEKLQLVSFKYAICIYFKLSIK